MLHVKKSVLQNNPTLSSLDQDVSLIFQKQNFIAFFRFEMSLPDAWVLESENITVKVSNTTQCSEATSGGDILQLHTLKKFKPAPGSVGRVFMQWNLQTSDW